MPRSPVSEACQINDLDLLVEDVARAVNVSEACQINDLDLKQGVPPPLTVVSEACQINDLDLCLRMAWS